ncbi:MAG: hypothetical protein ACFWT3_20725 [Pseudomonas lundensis]
MAVQDLLSQDEIDALLHGVDDGLVQTEMAAEPGSVKSYDLTSQDRIVRGRMPTLEMINERFARYTPHQHVQHAAPLGRRGRGRGAGDEVR